VDLEASCCVSCGDEGDVDLNRLDLRQNLELLLDSASFGFTVQHVWESWSAFEK